MTESAKSTARGGRWNAERGTTSVRGNGWTATYVSIHVGQRRGETGEYGNPPGVVVGQAYKQTLGTESAVTNRRVGALEGPWRRHRSRCRPARPARPSGMIWQLAAISQSDAELEQCKLRAPDAHLGRVSPGDFRTHIFQSRLSRFDSRGRDEDSIVIRHKCFVYGLHDKNYD